MPWHGSWRHIRVWSYSSRSSKSALEGALLHPFAPLILRGSPVKHIGYTSTALRADLCVMAKRCTQLVPGIELWSSIPQPVILLTDLRGGIMNGGRLLTRRYNLRKNWLIRHIVSHYFWVWLYYCSQQFGVRSLKLPRFTAHAQLIAGIVTQEATCRHGELVVCALYSVREVKCDMSCDKECYHFDLQKVLHVWVLLYHYTYELIGASCTVLLVGERPWVNPVHERPWEIVVFCPDKNCALKPASLNLICHCYIK